jgi:hypothetical protein
MEKWACEGWEIENDDERGCALFPDCSFRESVNIYACISLSLLTFIAQQPLVFVLCKRTQCDDIRIIDIPRSHKRE